MYDSYLQKQLRKQVCIPFKAIAGALVLIVSICLFVQEIYYNPTLNLITPFLGVALLLNGLTGTTLKRITYNPENQTILIERLGLFKLKTIPIKKENFKVNIRTIDGKKEGWFPNPKVVLVDGISDVEEIKCGIFGYNSKKMRRIYNTLKEIENQPVIETVKGFIEVSALQTFQ